LAGGVLLGVAQAAAIVIFGAGFKNVAALSMLLVVLLMFPQGIFSAFKGSGKGH
jgi:branched-chain amino acid transport system permease protein